MPGDTGKTTTHYILVRKGLFLSPNIVVHRGEIGIVVQSGEDLVATCIVRVLGARGWSREDSCQSGYNSLCAAPLMPMITGLNLITGLHDGHRRRGPKEVLGRGVGRYGK